MPTPRAVSCPDCLARDCDRHKEPQPELTATETLMLENMSKDRTLEWARRYDLFPKLVAALETVHEAYVDLDLGEMSFKHKETPCEVCALLQEARGERR